ncbi:hypothetical protein LshimejAT787_2300410 [Lyophyllum shimeji]|uniref:Uncharacterized protein n=1 Tax=Lyophyllum shimeji TaxID=47721 RepID=A0A9P3Q2I3_LYOSH|nr:hypothetical protein LshimejAT787_2300410 [Lyophyllum shimeji]
MVSCHRSLFTLQMHVCVMTRAENPRYSTIHSQRLDCVGTQRPLRHLGSDVAILKPCLIDLQFTSTS